MAKVDSRDGQGVLKRTQLLVFSRVTSPRIPGTHNISNLKDLLSRTRNSNRERPMKIP